jgi:hypothetical protein
MMGYLAAEFSRKRILRAWKRAFSSAPESSPAVFLACKALSSRFSSLVRGPTPGLLLLLLLLADAAGSITGGGDREGIGGGTGAMGVTGGAMGDEDEPAKV